MVSKKGVVLVVIGFLGVVFLAVGCALIHVFKNLIHNEVVDVSVYSEISDNCSIKKILYIIKLLKGKVLL